eukprot:TRINITY_DN4633_c0_g1_i1.p1 TRINITY_DN4633_c0_g1~~TRINITY_DN4633_c0_g1_i1.p1  ORF type:complete len:198 (-),score=99.48 TRINITY_DN4633_c0_g1_i1:20-613(-)
MDGTVRTWDVVSGKNKPLDWFRVTNPITSLDISPENDFLITSHLGLNGIYLWTNLSYFQSVFLKPIGDIPLLIDLPKELNEDESEKFDEDELNKDDNDNPFLNSKNFKVSFADSNNNNNKNTDSSDEENDSDEEEEEEEGEEEDNIDSPPKKKQKISESEQIPHSLESDLITLSNIPRSRLDNLLHLDTIKERNKPK